MNVNKNSWIYKIAMFGKEEWDEPNTLCQLFWRVVFGIIVICFLAIAALTVGSFILEPFLVLGNFLINDVWVGVIHDEIGIAAMSILNMFIVFVVWLIVENKPKKEKQPGLIRSYIKAKKEKFCPIINYVDKD